MELSGECFPIRIEDRMSFASLLSQGADGGASSGFLDSYESNL